MQEVAGESAGRVFPLRYRGKVSASFSRGIVLSLGSIQSRRLRLRLCLGLSPRLVLSVIVVVAAAEWIIALMLMEGVERVRELAAPKEETGGGL